MKNLLWVLALISFASCKKDYIDTYKSGGTAESVKLLWSSNLNSYKSSLGFIEQPVVFGENVLVSSSLNQNDEQFVMLNTQTGKEVWRWSDFIKPSGFYILENEWIKDNQMIWQDIGNGIYSIDLTTGKTIWKNKSQLVFDEYCNGIGNIFFILFDESLDEHH